MGEQIFLLDYVNHEEQNDTIAIRLNCETIVEVLIFCLPVMMT
jgi:hypothetical protein